MRNVLLAVVGLAVFAGAATSAPVPKAVLKKKPLRATIEPLPGEKVYSVDWDDVPFAKVADDLERLTGLMYLANDFPKVNVTLKAKKVCAPELFAQLDELIYPHGWVVIRMRHSFSLMPADAKLDKVHFTHVDVEELGRRMPHEPLAVVLDVGEAGREAGIELGEKRDSGVMVAPFGTTKLYAIGNGESLRAFVAEMGDHIKK